MIITSGSAEWRAMISTSAVSLHHHRDKSYICLMVYNFPPSWFSFSCLSLFFLSASLIICVEFRKLRWLQLLGTIVPLFTNQERCSTDNQNPWRSNTSCSFSSDCKISTSTNYKILGTNNMLISSDIVVGDN